MASALSSVLSFLPFSLSLDHSKFFCTPFLSAPPTPCVSLTFSSSCPKAGFNYIYSNFHLSHDSPVPGLISAKGINSARIKYQVWAKGELLKEREGGLGGGEKKTVRNREIEIQTQYIDRRKQENYPDIFPHLLAKSIVHKRRYKS